MALHAGALGQHAEAWSPPGRRCRAAPPPPRRCARRVSACCSARRLQGVFPGHRHFHCTACVQPLLTAARRFPLHTYVFEISRSPRRPERRQGRPRRSHRRRLAMETRVDEIADGIFRLSTFVPGIAPPAGFTFNQFLVLGDEPLMFHTGLRKMFALNRDALARIIAPERLRWIAYGHFEADECGAMNEWLAAAPAGDRRPRRHRRHGLAQRLRRPAAARSSRDGEVIDLGGGKRVRFIDTPHTPHGWDAGVLYEEIDGHAALRRPLHPARRRAGADLRRHRRPGDRGRGPLPLREPQPRHGRDAPRPRRPRAADARAHARAVASPATAPARSGRSPTTTTAGSPARWRSCCRGRLTALMPSPSGTRSATARAAGSPAARRPPTTPARSAALRFWLNLRLALEPGDRHAAPRRSP